MIADLVLSWEVLAPFSCRYLAEFGEKNITNNFVVFLWKETYIKTCFFFAELIPDSALSCRKTFKYTTWMVDLYSNYDKFSFDRVDYMGPTSSILVIFRSFA